MRLIGMLIIAVLAVLIWYVRTSRREARLLRESAADRASRKVTLEQAAATVEQQAELSRSVVRRIEEAPVEIPWSLRVALVSVIGELDGVAQELRAPQPVVVVARKRPLIRS